MDRDMVNLTHERTRHDNHRPPESKLMPRTSIPVGVHLHNWSIQHGVNLTAMARRVGCSPEHMRRIAGGLRPDFTLAMKIETATSGIVHRGCWSPPYRMPAGVCTDTPIIFNWKPQEAPAQQAETI